MFVCPLRVCAVKPKNRIVVWFRNDLRWQRQIGSIVHGQILHQYPLSCVRRVHDNPLLTAAADLLEQQGEDKVEVLPIYCITQQDLEPAPWSPSRTTHAPFSHSLPVCLSVFREENPRLLARGRFLIEALTELKIRLRELGSDLLIVISDPHRFIPHLFNTRHGQQPHSICHEVRCLPMCCLCLSSVHPPIRDGPGRLAGTVVGRCGVIDQGRV